MTKEELISKLTAAVGGTPYGDAIIAEAEATWGDKDKKYGQDMKDRLDERIGVLKAYEKIHREADENAKAVSEAEKILIAEKALAAIQE